MWSLASSLTHQDGLELEDAKQLLRTSVREHRKNRSEKEQRAAGEKIAEHARELLLDFADFTRYSFRRHGEFTTLAEELRSIERYLTLEQARFGGRLEVTLRVSPEVLPVAVPFLCLQPLVENAVRHGLEGRQGTGRITIIAEDAGNEASISIEDDGVGMEPERVLANLVGEGGDHVGLGNVDERLRSVFGDEHGLVVETAPGAGTRISLRVPKYAPGVHAS